jgi:hypothetical protein
MIAELLVLQRLLDNSQLVTPPTSSRPTSTSTTTRSKAEAAYNAYKDKLTDYLGRFRYRR